MASTNNSKRKAPSAEVDGAFEVEVPAMKNQRQRNISDEEESFSLNNDRSLALLTPRENDFSAKTWWMVDLSCVGETSPHGATALVKRCMRVHDWDETKARKVLAAYRQFLTIKKKYKDWNAEKFSPCYLVDEMWHVHILDVMTYCHDMMLLCGHIVGHNPDGALDIEAKRKRDHGTRVCLTEEFREYDKEVWDYTPNAAAARAIHDRSAQSAASGDSGGSLDPGPELSNEAIHIRLKDHVGEETMWKIKKTCQLGRVFNAYAERKGVDDDAFRFLLDGEPLSYDVTPAILELEDDDQIDCILQQRGC